MASKRPAGRSPARSPRLSIFIYNTESGALAAIRKAKPRGVTLSADPAAPAGLAALKAAADFCIGRGLPLEIEGLAPCLLPGYARYLRRPAKARPCPRAAGCFLKGDCAGIPASFAGSEDVFRPPERPATDLEKCLLAVLAAGRPLSTAQVLRAAKGIKICASCSNDGEVFRAAGRLVGLGLVSRKFSGGKYIWQKL